MFDCQTVKGNQPLINDSNEKWFQRHKSFTQPLNCWEKQTTIFDFTTFELLLLFYHLFQWMTKWSPSFEVQDKRVCSNRSTDHQFYYEVVIPQSPSIINVFLLVVSHNEFSAWLSCNAIQINVLGRCCTTENIYLYCICIIKSHNDELIIWHVWRNNNVPLTIGN